MLSWIISLLALASSAVADPPAAGKVDLSANAALKYWQAFASMPKLDEEQKKLLMDVSTTPVPAKVKEFVASAGGSLRELHNGAALRDCAWGVSYQDGFHAQVQHAVAARQLGSLALQRARIRFGEGSSKAALDDIFAVLTMARHLSTDGTLLSLLVGYAVEQAATDVLAAHLPNLEPAVLRKLITRLKALPPIGDMATCMTTEERAGYDWFVRQVQETRDPDRLLDFLTSIMESRAQAAKLLKDCGGTAEGILERAAHVRPIYATWSGQFLLPAREFTRKWEAEAERLKDNPVFRLLAPAMAKCRDALARYETKMAMRDAAIAVLLDGPGALKSHPDPFDKAPFTYAPFDGGFELRSKQMTIDKPLILTVGRRK